MNIKEMKQFIIKGKWEQKRENGIIYMSTERCRTTTEYYRDSKHKNIKETNIKESYDLNATSTRQQRRFQYHLF